jgi:hypothetical protein
VLSKIAPRGLYGVDSTTGWPTAGTIPPLIWEDAAFLAPIINSIEGSTKVDYTPTQIGTRPPDPAACRQIAQSGYGTFCEAVHGCACDRCSVEFLDCNDNEGCRNIIECALERGCRGIDCASPAPKGCADVIGQYGGTGTGGLETTLALKLSDCTVAAPACATTCP